ncbi:MAG: glycoside hydrolase family 127 protein [Tannerella sp.]|jgi:DUF1680 family protein|nr:glycoside hydrolase family 127 protein [Tannerella sp.]
METCVTVTWLKLCRSLLALTGNPIYADRIELAACNALPAAMKDDASQIVMYSPLDGLRDPGHGQCGMHINCCNANGPRGFALLPQVAVMRSDRDVIVNLYTDLSAEIVWDRKNKVSLNQQTRYPEDGVVTIRVDAGRPESFVMALRIPAWSKENSVSVNGETLAGVTPGEYFRIDRTWKKGDVIRLQLDVRARVVRQNGSAAIVRGPVVLARDSRFGDGFVDEAARILDKDGYVELTPAVRKPDGIWLAFTAPLAPGTFDAEGAHPKQIHFCDFASAGNTWNNALRYRVWIPEPMNVTQTIYEPYDK